MHTETKHDLGKLTVTEVAPQRRLPTRCRPYVEHIELCECELLDTVDLHFQIEYSTRGLPFNGGEVVDLSATLVDAEAYCGKEGTTVQLRREFRENVERRFNDRLRKEGPLCETLTEKCFDHWRSEMEHE